MLADENTEPPWKGTFSNQAIQNPQGKTSSAGNESKPPEHGGESNPPQVHSKFIGSCTIPKNFRKQIKMLNTRELLFTLLKA